MGVNCSHALKLKDVLVFITTKKKSKLYSTMRLSSAPFNWLNFLYRTA